jgi:hypothetical protein
MQDDSCKFYNCIRSRNDGKKPMGCVRCARNLVGGDMIGPSWESLSSCPNCRIAEAGERAKSRLSAMSDSCCGSAD